MIYVMSDLHGCYQEYKNMLKRIHFSNNDVLYMLGDAIDRGPDGFRILLDMKQHKNIIPLIGNHEYVALQVLDDPKIMNSDPTSRNTSMEFRCWYADGGKDTIERFRKLNPTHRKWIVDYMKSFKKYQFLTVNGRKFFLVHAGISCFEEGMDLENHPTELFVYERYHYDNPYWPDTTIISGHTPTFIIDKDSHGRIYHYKNHIVVDCGIAYGGTLGCLCLNTMEEFYEYKVDQTETYSKNKPEKKEERKIYVMSDLHGCYEEYKKMLKAIHFSNNDVLYMLGDAIDRGPDGFRILLDMKQHKNIIPLVGNHEYVALQVLDDPKIMNSDPTSRNTSMEFRCWYADGGKDTIERFRKLNPTHRKWIVDYMKSFKKYQFLTVNGRKFFLVHAGISCFEEGMDLENHPTELFVYERYHYDNPYWPDTTIISGHTPTFIIDKDSHGRIYHYKNHIVIDCGIAYGGTLGCLCLNNMKEYYVNKVNMDRVYKKE